MNRRRVVLCVLLVALSLVAYGRVWQLGFVDYDDPLYVTENQDVLAGLSGHGVAWAFTTTTAQNWHPLTWLSLMLDATLAEANPPLYHATNLLLHLANAVLLFLVLERGTGFAYRSAFVAALFAVHPLHVESVAWVAERKDVLSTLFWLLTLVAYERYAERPSLGRYAAVLVPFVLGLMAKPMLVSLPLVLLLLDFWPLGRLEPGRARMLLIEKVPLFVFAAASSVVTLIVQRPAMQAMEGVPFGARLANALVSCVAYIGKTSWPSRLAVFYPFPRGSLPLWEPTVAAILVLGISVAAILVARRHPWLPVGWFWYVVTLAPVIGLVQVGLQARADRYTYVPLIGLFIVVAWGVPVLLGRFRRLLAAAAVLVVLVLAGCTFVQVGYWRGDADLFAHAVEVTPANAFAHFKLSAALDAKGETDQAVLHLREALRIDPAYARAHFNLTSLLARRGRVEEVAQLCREEQARWPTDEHTLIDLGVLAYLEGRRGEAEARFREALKLYPESVPARHNLEALRASRPR